MATATQHNGKNHTNGKQSDLDAPTREELRLAYTVALESRILEEHIVRLASRGEIKFGIWGPGEEIHGTAFSLAISRVIKDPKRYGLVPHYRSGALVSMWTRIHGHTEFGLDVFRQQLSKVTDRMSHGRQMVNHLDMPEFGVLPVQSPVGMQLGKAAGYAFGFKHKGINNGMTVGIIGDGTSAEGDLHDTMNAMSVWSLPTMVMVTDNRVAISTTPDNGRGIKDFKSYAAGFDVKYFSCDGRDFFDVYNTVLAAAKYISENQKPAFMYVHDLPRFNGHSSAADMTFDLSQEDPMVTMGAKFVEMGILNKDESLRRVKGEGRDFFSHHDLGVIGDKINEKTRAMMEQVRSEPEPEPSSVMEHIYAPFPDVVEPTAVENQTCISYAGAIRAAMAHTISDKGGVLVGQDVGGLGGVMTATAGLKAMFPEKVVDAPLNEPLIVGTAMGLGLHGDLRALPEIQFGDYSLNAFHWLVLLGNTYWCSAGQTTVRLTLRMPTDPFGGGAVYHSMSEDGYFTPIPGLVILMPSTSWDIYGLLMTAAEYDGPVVVLEPKWMYRQNLGPAIEGEPTDPAEIKALKKAIMRKEVPQLSKSHRVPFSKGVIRRSGEDLTIVAWGRAVWTSLDAAKELEKQGVSAEVIDLRTLVPPDLDLVYESVGRTGRLVVAAEDRSFAGFVRTIQGHAVEKFPGLPSRAIGQKNVPGIAQNLKLENWTVLKAVDVIEAANDVMNTEIAGETTTQWIPPRFFVS
jgi:2-oxoisovalerate dehydrogenase E1 component